MAKRDIIKVDFSNGEASEHVTGSCILVTTPETSILLECGLSQSNNLRADYFANKEKFNFKTKEVDYVFCMHAHADHSARIPLLYKRGCNATIVVPECTKRILNDMFTDSAHIMERDSALLKRMFEREVEPLYDDGDVTNALSHMAEFKIGEKIQLNDNIAFRFTHSGHIIQGTQLELWLTSNNITKKIIYTSDLGNDLVSKHYVEPFEPLEKCDLLIGESTYGNPSRAIASASQRKKDIEKLHTIVQQKCIEQRHKILIPVFALDRLPEILTELYLLFKDDPSFEDIPVVVDTPLGLKHIHSYFNILSGDKLKLLENVFNWPNIVQVGKYTETETWARTPKACIILASSGMLTAGRSTTYAEYMVNDETATVVFCGYSTEGSIGWKIKHVKDYKTIEINGKKKRNRCAVLDLHSFSSHMQFPSLLKYYSDISCSQIALVHGQMDSKLPFAGLLKKELEKKNKTTKVTIVNKSTVIKL